jgi:uncharacterized membrane protein
VPLVYCRVRTILHKYPDDLFLRPIVNQSGGLFWILSDIGGKLGLWVGMSVLSVAEVLELVVLIIVWCSSKKGDTKTDPNFDEE